MYPTLYRGKPEMDPEHVVTLQERLNAHGARLEVDGDYGRKTEAAVEQFQSSYGLNPDGVVGQDTWRWLEVESFVPRDEALVDDRKKELLGYIDSLGPEVEGPQREVLRWAVHALGLKETPDGSNTGREIKDIVGGYYSVLDERKYGAPPWCALFTSWAIRRAVSAGSWTTTPMRSRFGSAAQFEAWAKKKEVWIPADALQPDPGAVFVMGRGNSSSDVAESIGSGHVGFVVKYENGWVHSIDGNVRNAVSEAVRPVENLRGYVNWWNV